LISSVIVVFDQFSFSRFKCFISFLFWVINNFDFKVSMFTFSDWSIFINNSISSDGTCSFDEFMFVLRWFGYTTILISFISCGFFSSFYFFFDSGSSFWVQVCACTSSVSRGISEDWNLWFIFGKSSISSFMDFSIKGFFS